MLAFVTEHVVRDSGERFVRAYRGHSDHPKTETFVPWDDSKNVVENHVAALRTLLNEHAGYAVLREFRGALLEGVGMVWVPLETGEAVVHHEPAPDAPRLTFGLVPVGTETNEFA